MGNLTRLSDDAAMRLMVRVGAAHVSVSRGALPFVVPSNISADETGSLVLSSSHPTVIRGAERGDIAAVQVDVAQAVVTELFPEFNNAGAIAHAQPRVLDGANSAHGADQSETSWSITATGPLALQHGHALLLRDELMLNVECLSSTYGHVIDPLLRSSLAATQ